MKKIKDEFSLYMMNYFNSIPEYPGMKELADYHEWKGTKCPNDILSYKVFWNSLKFIKILGIVFFIFLAVINIFKNNNYGLIRNKPLQFLLESVIFGASIIIPMIFLLVLRKGQLKENPRKYIALFFMLFIVFIGINYILEASGLWAWMFDYKETNNNIFIDVITGANKPLALVGLGILIIIIYALIIIITAANFINISIKDVYDYNINSYILFTFELLLFGMMSAAPVFYIANNRNDLTKNTTIEFILASLKFSIIFYIFQYSGLWEVIFEGDKISRLEVIRQIE